MSQAPIWRSLRASRSRRNRDRTVAAGRTIEYDAPHSNKGDRIYLWEDNTFKDAFWLKDGVTNTHDGRWFSQKTGQIADFALEAGKAYFYRHHFATNGPVTGTNFVWQPVKP